MRTLRKLAVLLVVAVAVALFIVGFFGVSTKYGEISNVYVNGAKNIRYDVDFAPNATIVFAPHSSGDEEVVPTAEEMDAMKLVMEKRLEMTHLGDYDVSCDYENGKILVHLALNNSVASDFDWFVGMVGAKGEVQAYEGNLETTEGHEPIFTNDNVTKTTYDYTQDIFAVYHQLNMELDSDGRKALRDSTTTLKQELDDTEEIQYISIWYEGTKVGTIRVTDVIKNGKITFGSSSIDTATLNDLMVLLNSGSMPYEMDYESIASYPASFGEDVEDSISNIGLALLCGFGAIVLYLLVRFRIIGFAGVVAIAGATGFAMFFMTGFMTGRGIAGTLAAFAGLITVALLCVETTIRNGNAVRQSLKDSTVLVGVPQGMKSTMADSIIVYIVALLMGILLMLCGPTGIMASLMRLLGVGQTGMLAIGTFGSVLIAGVPAAFVFCVLGSRFFVGSFMDVFKKPGLYGGRKHA